MAEKSNTHAVMHSSLAKALIEAGVKHYDLGGQVLGGMFGGLGGVALGGNVNTGTNIPNFALPTAGSIFGTTNFRGTAAPINPGVTQEQLNQGYNQAQTGVQAQQGLANTLGAQVPGAMANQQTLAQQLLGQNQSGQAMSNQSALANQLMMQAQGQGPNPAAQALNNATGANMQQQAALMAGQRGAGANPALLARMASQQGAGIEQNAIGQNAVMQAQQQIAAQQQLAALSNQQMGQTLNAQGQLAGLSSNQIQQTQGAQQAASQAGLSQEEILQRANQAANNANVAMQSNLNDVNAGISSGNAKNQATGITGLLSSGIGAAAMMASEGAVVPGKAKVKGDSENNDIVPALLSPGEVVLPRSVTQAPDAEKKAAEFMKHIQGKKGKSEGYEKVASSKKSLADRVAELEKMMCGGKV